MTRHPSTPRTGSLTRPMALTLGLTAAAAAYGALGLLAYLAGWV